MNLEGMPPDYAGKAYDKIGELMRQSEAREEKLLAIQSQLRALKERHNREHDALCAIVNAANANSHPIHFKVRRAIDLAQEVLCGD
jgi:hypothetical protein